jgi:hypothetical protein
LCVKRPDDRTADCAGRAGNKRHLSGQIKH